MPELPEVETVKESLKLRLNKKKITKARVFRDNIIAYPNKDEFIKYTKILYAEAKMIAGLPIDNPTEISTLICDVISK